MLLLSAEQLFAHQQQIGNLLEFAQRAEEGGWADSLSLLRVRRRKPP